MRIDRRFQDNITTESRASLVTEGFLGNRYVEITRGYTGTPLPTNGEVQGEQEVAIKDVVQRGADLVENLGTLAKDAQGLVGGLRKGQGSLGKLMTDDQLYNHLNASATRLDEMIATTQEGKNSLGKILATDQLYQRIDAMLNRIDSVLAEIQDQKGTLGKLVYDPSKRGSLCRKRTTFCATFARAKARSGSSVRMKNCTTTCGTARRA